MSPPSISRGAAVAALVLALAACGQASKTTGAKHEAAPVPLPQAKPEPKTEPKAEPMPAKQPEDAYSKAAAPKETPPDAAPMPKTPSTGDPPVAPDTADAAHKEFQDSIDARLKKVDEQMTALAAKVKAASEDKRDAMQKTFDELSLKRDDAATKLDQIRTIAADKWDTAKADLEKFVGELETAAAEANK